MCSANIGAGYDEPADDICEYCGVDTLNGVACEICEYACVTCCKCGSAPCDLAC